MRVNPSGVPMRHSRAARLYLRSGRRIAQRASAPARAARAPITPATGTDTVSPALDSKMKTPMTPAEVSNTQMSIGRAKAGPVRPPLEETNAAEEHKRREQAEIQRIDRVGRKIRSLQVGR